MRNKESVAKSRRRSEIVIAGMLAPGNGRRSEAVAIGKDDQFETIPHTKLLED
jgi:hypothetical protein